MNEIREQEKIIIEDMIYEIRGVQVMLDSDIAKLYQVETKRINEAVIDLITSNRNKDYQIIWATGPKQYSIIKEELLKKFWNNSLENSRSIDMHMKALRQKVFSRTSLQLITLLKVGYKLEKK